MPVAIELKHVKVEIQGLPPGMLMASKRIMDDTASGGGKTGKHRPPDVEAELHAYWTGSGKSRSLAVPWNNLYKSICTAAGHFKFKGAQRMTSIVAATVSCETDYIALRDGNGKLLTEYEVYSEWCRIPPGPKGAVVKIARPRIAEWKATFTMVVDDEMYKANALEDIIKHAGKMVGIGPWRPALKGPYGRFVVAGFAIE